MVDYPHPVSSLLVQHLLASLLRSQATRLAYLLCFQSARCLSLSVWPTRHKFLSPLPAFVAAKEKLCILLPLFGTASSALSLIMGPDLCTERVFLYHGACWSPGLMLQLWRGLHTHCLLNFTAINKSPQLKIHSRPSTALERARWTSNFPKIMRTGWWPFVTSRNPSGNENFNYLLPS